MFIACIDWKSITAYWEMNKQSFSEIINLIEPKLYMNNHWMASYTIKNLLCQSEIQDGHYHREDFA